jgi:LysR family transcriptional regulator (chromosome initiation inhibitor)
MIFNQINDDNLGLGILMIDYTQLATLAAILKTGSFDAAADSLSITQSAVSQRIKALEDHVGTVLILRETPARATDMGARLFRHYENVGLLERDLDVGIGRDTATPVRVAVNADSLATWIIPALAQCEDLLYDVIVDDQDHSADWLRRGEVVAAVTARAAPIQGCDVHPLGAMRYCASASPAFVAKWFSDGVTAATLSAAPNMVFNPKDGLQRDWMRKKIGHTVAAPTHWMPSTQGFVDGAASGLGWGMNPEPLIRAHLDAGTLVPLDPDLIFEVPLFWQVNRRMAPAISDLTRSIRKTAKDILQ